MSTYLLGLATLPLAALAFYASTWLLGWLVTALASIGLGVGTSNLSHRRRVAAAITYGARKVRVIRFHPGTAVVLLRGYDPEAATWAERSLDESLSLEDVRAGRRFPEPRGPR